MNPKYEVWVGGEMDCEPIARCVYREDAIACARRYETGVVSELMQQGDQLEPGDIVFATSWEAEAEAI